MNKLYTLLTLTFITALHTPTTLPMTRFVRAAARTPKLAPKITPTLAAPQRRFLSTVPKIASLPKFTGDRNNNGKKQQRTFTRSYPWLPALGAAAAFGLNMQREKAECLTMGYGIYFINEYTILVMISDAHVDDKYRILRLDHIKQINLVLDYAKTLNCPILFNMERQEALTNYLKKTVNVNELMMWQPLRRALEHNDQEDNILYKNFDLRELLDQPQAASICYQRAKEIAQNACLKLPVERSLRKYFENLNPNSTEATSDLTSNTTLLCNILKQAEKAEQHKKPTVIFTHAGGLHNANVDQILQRLNFRCATTVGMFSREQMTKFLAQYGDQKTSTAEKQKFFINFAASIISEIESWRKQQEQSPGKPD